MLTDDQIRALLAVAMGYDNRRPGELNVAAWREAATRGRWTFDAAVDAIHDHYARNTDFLMPGHITTKITTGHGQPPQYVALPAAQPASDEHRRRMRDLIGEAFALPRGRRRWAPRTGEGDPARQAARAELDAIRRADPGGPP
ncbi:hypothetical protein [Amycolatopsis sp. NPDC004378]